jgi:lipoic acid synthetase
MSDPMPLDAPSRHTPETHLRRGAKLAHIPVKMQADAPPLRKPAWIRVRAPSGPGVARIKRLLREQGLASVCEEAACPNLGECFHRGTATFMVMGDICTRRCPFCDVAHGHPAPLDPEEPAHLARAVQTMGLTYVVITSVDRDDLRDGGAAHIAACVDRVRAHSPGIRVETLVPDFRGRQARALDALATSPPDVFNHNLETVPRLYPQARPGAGYWESLRLLQAFRRRCPQVPTKSGLMLGLGEHPDEVVEVLRDLRAHGCDLLTLGQYLQPSRDHLPVARFVPPEEFTQLGALAERLGFSSVASAPLVRSSYHADRLAGQVLREA